MEDFKRGLASAMEEFRGLVYTSTPDQREELEITLQGMEIAASMTDEDLGNTEINIYEPQEKASGS